MLLFPVLLMVTLLKLSVLPDGNDKPDVVPPLKEIVPLLETKVTPVAIVSVRTMLRVPPGAVNVPALIDRSRFAFNAPEPGVNDPPACVKLSLKVKLPEPCVKSARNAKAVLNVKSTTPFVRLSAVMLVLRVKIMDPAPLVLIVTAGAATVSVGNDTPAGKVTVLAEAPEMRRVALPKPPTAPSKVEAIETLP